MHRTSLLIASVALVFAAAAASADPTSTDLPLAARGGDVIYGKIEPVGDLDTYSIFLGPKDVLTVTAKEVAPAFGLLPTLSLTDPSGTDATPVVKGQGKQKVSFVYTAASAGTYMVTIGGDPGGFGGSMGTYQLVLGVKRAKNAPAKFADPAGGPISFSFSAPAGSTVTLSASTKKNGVDLTSLQRPDGTAEPDFVAALKIGKNRRSASVVKFPLTGGDGTYELRGAYDAGATATVKIAVATGEKKVTRRLNDEPKFDTLLLPFPSVGVGGTLVNVAGANFDSIPVVDNSGKVVDHLYPHFTVGGIAVPPASVSHPNGTIYRFPIPDGLAPNATYDMTAIDADGQGARLSDAFYIVPPPQVTGVSIATAGPAGGRVIRITGQDLRPNTTVIFDTTFVQPTTSRPTYFDVVAPAHAPGDVQLSIRDEFGQTAAVPGVFTYLNIGSNRIKTIFPATIQAVGGETVTVRGADFGADTVLAFDGVAQSSTLVAGDVMTFTAPAHADGTFKLRVTDQYQQTSAVDVRVKGFTDATDATIPSPVATTNAVDGWRATRVLVGDVNGDGRPDLVLLRPEQAFGGDVNRPRLRLLLADGQGGFTDATAAKLPGISGDEDWRAKDGVLVDLFGAGRLDLAIITDDPISGGSRPGLRILRNTGGGTFVDATSTSVPPATSYGDRCQGVAIAAANLDSAAGADLVIVNTTYFTDASGPAYYPGTRVLVNDGSGVFSFKTNALPAVSPSAATQYQGDAVAVGDVTGDGKPDIVITQLHPPADPANPGSYVRAASLLVNNGSAVFTDVSNSNLPAASDPEYMQGTRIYLADVDGDNDLDLVVASVTRIVSPVTGQLSTTPALRVFANNGSGTFTALTGVLPDADESDQLQADGLAIGDITGRGKADIVLVSSRAPNAGARGGRMLVKVDGGWASGSKGLPDYLTGDDLRGADVALADVDADGALDLVIVRDEADETVRNTRVIRNPLKDFVNATATSIPAPVTTANAVDGWRAKRVLVGDLNGDGRPDLVLLRPEHAAGADANRPRVRVLLGGPGGVFTDVTAASFPGVGGDEDWRAKDGVLVDVDGDGDLDLAIITDEAVSGGVRSSLRVLKNNGNGVFTDSTSAAMPAATTYGDTNQGVAIATGRRAVGSGVNLHYVYDLVITHSSYFTGAGPTYFPGTRLLVNDGTGVFSRSANAIPAVTASSPTQYQGASLSVADVNNDGYYDILVSRSTPPADPQNPGGYVLAASLLVNDGTGVFTDVSATKLPAKSDPEYLQGDRVFLADVDGDGRPDIVVASAARIVSPVTLQTATTPALRLFINDGAGKFTALATSALPGPDGADYLQASDVAVGDVTGDNRADIFLVSAQAPNAGGRAGRLLVNIGGAWVAAPKMLPDPSPVGDDLRGASVLLSDVDPDGDLDVVIVRDEPNDAVKNAVVLKNRRK
jgi:hypothetical protein